MGEQAAEDCLPERQATGIGRRNALPSNERDSPGGMRGLDLIDKRDGRDTESAHQEPAIVTRSEIEGTGALGSEWA
jgi:hypothetical protein